MRYIILLFLLFTASAFGQEIPPDAAKLSWTPPTEREDNTPLPENELQGFEVLWGTSQTNLDQTIFVPVGTNEYMVTALTEGTWYFAVKAVDTDGLESGLSAVVSKTIQPQQEPTFPADPQRIGIR
jgi:hypothetical protein